MNLIEAWSSGSESALIMYSPSGHWRSTMWRWSWYGANVCVGGGQKT